MADNVVLHKKSSVENKKPLASDLQYGEIAVNTFDGNMFVKISDSDVAEMKRLDTRLNETDVSIMNYDSSGNLSSVEYTTGNITVLNYDSADNLSTVYYFATDGLTHLYTQTLGYDSDENVVSAMWSVAP